MLDFRGGVVVENHIHASQACRGGILLLPVEADVFFCRLSDFQEQRARSACRVIYGRCRRRIVAINADNLGHNTADFSRRVELAFALAAFRSEMAHQIFIGVSQNVIAFSPVLAEIKRLVFKNAN